MGLLDGPLRSVLDAISSHQPKYEHAGSRYSCHPRNGSPTHFILACIEAIFWVEERSTFFCARPSWEQEQDASKHHR